MSAPAKEFVMTEADFRFISQSIYRNCGIVLGDHKRDMVYSRLARRIRALGLRSFEEYIGLIESNHEEEHHHFVNAITTNLTAFFREAHHFEFLKKQLIPELKRLHTQDKRIRLWSAGCSTGMEAYSIAMTLYGQFPSNWDVKILATDLNSDVLDVAKSGIYALEQTTGLDKEKLQQFFRLDSAKDRVRVKDKLKQMITFKRLNLLQPWPMAGPFDLIFCRNVVIYFDQKTKNQLIRNFASLLRPHGYVILGHSESMSRAANLFKPLGSTIYRKL